MRTRFFTPLLIFLLCLSSCNNKEMRELSQLEPKLRENPDSILTVLINMSTQDFGEKATAYHALLTTAELDILHYNLNDSLMDIAHSYYSRSGSQHQKMLEAYYYGRFQRQNHNLSEAILALYHAADLAKNEGNYLYSGLSYRNISEIFSSEYEDIDASQEIQKAIDQFERAQLTDYATSAQLDYAMILQQTLDNEKVDSMYMEVISHSSNPGLVSLAYREYAYFLDIGTTEDAEKVLSLYEKSGRKEYPAGHLARMAYAYSFLNKRISDSLMNRAYSVANDVIDTARICHHNYLIAKNQQNYKEALHNFEFVNATQDSITRLKLQQSLTSSLNDIYRREGEIANLRAKNANLMTIIITGLSLLVTTLLFGLLLRNRKKRRELLDSIYETRKILQEREDDNLRLVKTMMLSKIAGLEEAAKKYEDAKDTRDEATAYRELRVNVTALQKDKNLYKEIEVALNTYHSGLISKVREDFPDMTDYTFQLLLLLFAHIPQSTIMLLRGASAGSIKTAKYRFRAMFRDSVSVNKNQYLSLLDA